MFDFIQSINIAVSQFLYGLASQNIYTEYAAIFLSDGIFVLSISLYVLAVFPLRKKGIYTWTLWKDITPAILAGIVAFVTKMTTNVARPFVTLGIEPFVPQPDPFGSFPSWHLAVFTAFAFTLFQRHRRLGIYVVALVPFVAIGRIAIGVHWLTDVAAGAVMGLIAAYRVPLQHAKHRASDYLTEKVIQQKHVHAFMEKQKKRIRS